MFPFTPCLAGVAFVATCWVGSVNGATTGDDLFRLPDEFMIGAGSSAYQIEGAWNTSGRSISNMDVEFGDNEDGGGRVACDSYHKFKEDVRMLKLMGATHYRFSISWTRLLPTGEADNVNPDGVRYYNALLDELQENGIEPLVTLMHLELPYVLEKKFGGWYDEKIVGYFINFATTAFREFGDRVRYWVTINQPHVFCAYGMGNGGFGLVRVEPGVADYLCGHYQILAHARAYHIYKEHFANQKGVVGITLSNYFTEPCSTSFEDVRAAERHQLFEVGWFLDPLLLGDYPAAMRRQVDENSLAEGRSQSRLPTFTQEQRANITGTLDFIGINAYYGFHACEGVPEGAAKPSFMRDLGVILTESSDQLKPPRESLYTPWAIRASLLWIKDRYFSQKQIPIIITENGVSSDGSEGLHDEARTAYFSNFLREMLKAIHIDKVRVVGYFAWSLTDNFEWVRGYTSKYGLVEIDFSSPNRTRTPRDSLYFLKNVITTRFVPEVQMPSATATPSAALCTIFCGLLISCIAYI